MPQDYVALVLTHAPLYSDLLWSSGQTIGNVGAARTAINNSGKTVIVISGHTHFDCHYFPSGSFLNITSECAKMNNVTEDTTTATKGSLTAYYYGRNINNATSESWDVVVLRPNSSKLFYIRFGAGVNRIFNYIPVSVTTTESLTSVLTGTLTWSSSNTSVATVSNGTVTAVASGRAEIKAADTDGNFEVWFVDV